VPLKVKVQRDGGATGTLGSTSRFKKQAPVSSKGERSERRTAQRGESRHETGEEEAVSKSVTIPLL